MFTRYNFDKIRQGYNISIKDLINELEKLNPQANITICGDPKIYIHVADDDSVVTLDSEVDEDWYYDQDGNGYFDEENIPIIKPISFDNIKEEK